MKIVKIIVAAILFLASTKVVIESYQTEYNEGWYGALTAYLIVLAICFWLIKSSLPKKSVKKDKQFIKEVSSYDEKINSLKELRDKEILTEQEYKEKVENLEKQKQGSEVKLSEDYKKLKSLFDDGILTKEEFESKIEIIKLNSTKSSESRIDNTVQTKTEENYNEPNKYVSIFLKIVAVIFIILVITNALGLWE